MARLDEIDVSGLADLSHADLVPIWADVMEGPPPRRMSAALMSRLLAFEIQAKRSRGITPAFRKRLARVASGQGAPPTSGLKPGGRLVRTWNDVTHVVDVTETGFVWNGERYTSLSAIARAITGTTWSGPRFFGLAKRKRPA